jgi:hypothetical protein
MIEDQEQRRLDLQMLMHEAARELRARQRLQELMSSPCTVCGWFPRSPCPANMPNCPQQRKE